MAGGVANVASGVETIDALLGLFRWGNVNLTYNFPDTASYYNAATYFTDGSVPSAPTFDFATFAPANASLQAAITNGITTQLMAVAPLNYTLTTPGNAAADSSFAQASLFADAELGAPPGGIGYYPGLVDRGGDAWFNVDQPRFNNVQIGDSAYYVVLHELGHNVGLKHGHANDRPGPTTDLLPDDINSIEFSVMTYRHYVGAPDVPVAGDTQADSFPQSLMMYDIAAIQYMYGANFNYNSTNTVYTFSTTTGEMFVNGVGQGMPQGNRIFRTIWDGDGTDTYDLSNYATSLQIDLAPGGWSTFDAGQRALLHIGDTATTADDIYARGNVANALLFEDDPRSLIENAIGGSGNDVIKGNSAANVLTGNGGNDRLFGFDGVDTLSGGLGADTLDGGAGSDRLSGGDGNDTLIGGAAGDLLKGGAGSDLASYAGASAGVIASLANPAVNTGDAAGDSYSGIEGLIGTAFTDALFGNSAANDLRGGGGNDKIAGGAGNDRIEGGGGNDVLQGGAGSDTFVFVKTFGQDKISDWQEGFLFNNDVISFQGMDLTMADLSIAYSAGNAVVSVIGTTNQITILGVPVGSIGASDFLF